MESMREALDEVEASGEDGIVVDTTGSVVYTGERYAAAPAPHDGRVPRGNRWRRRNLDRAIPVDPKTRPLGDLFSERPGELAKDAVARCYPQLLAYRKQLYERSHTSLCRWRTCERRSPMHAASLKSSIRRHGPRDEIRSTLGRGPEVSLRDAVLRGSAPDGGLYMPVEMPRLPSDFPGRWRSLSFPELACESAHYSSATMSTGRSYRNRDCALDFPVR